MRKLFCVPVLVALFAPGWCLAQSYEQQLQSAAEVGKTVYLMFQRANNPPTQRMANTVQSVVNRNSARAAWMRVNVNDPAAAQLVKQFDATRIPLPATFGIAPNGAVTGVFRMKVAPQQLMSAILTPKHAEMIKAMQDSAIAVVCFQPAGGGFVPSGVEEFEKNPDFQGLIHRITVASDEPGESAFFNRLNVNPNLKSPVVLLFVPPGTHLGTFNANVTGEKLANTVHDSGQCNCEACKKRRR